MAVYYKFKSAKDYDSIPIDGHFISVLNLKEKIFESKHLGRGTDFDLVVTNAQTNEEYLDEAALVPKNTSVLIRRVPGRPRMNIVTQPAIQQDEPKVEASMPDNAQPTNYSFIGAGSSVMKYPEDSEWDEFGNDLYAIPDAVPPVQTSNPIQDAPAASKADEDSKIKALIDTPALDWQRQSDGFGSGRGFGRGMGGRMMGGRGFGRGGFERKTPPPGYVCHRCSQPGHLIQHCPTNGVPEYDVKRVKPPTGIPKSMLMATPEGSYALPSGDVAVLKPNEAAFEKEIEGLPSNRHVGELPPELHCPLCKEVMKDAVLTSKCCFTSYCDRCIRDHFITKSTCVCGANNVLADDLLPNKTVRDTINRIMETNNSSTENGGSAFQVQDMESKMENPRIQQKVPSPTHSALSKGNKTPPPQVEGPRMVKDVAGQSNPPSALQNMMVNIPDVSEATRDSMTGKEHDSQGNVLLGEEQKQLSGEAGKKKKKKKIRVPPNEMQWRNPQDVAMENYMMPMGPSSYNPYWNGMQQPGMEGFLPQFGGPMPPFMGYGPGPLDVPFGLLPQDPFGVPNMMMHHPPPFPPQRDLAEMGMGMGMGMGMNMNMGMGMGMNFGPPAMSREEFEARKADLRRKREIERRGERDFSRDREFSREMSSNGDVSSLRPKSRQHQPTSTDDHIRYPHRSSPPSEHLRHRSERPSPPLEHLRRRSERPSPPPDRLERDPDLPRPSSKRKSLDNDHHNRENHHREDSHHRHRRSDSSAKSSAPESPPPVKPSAAAAAAAAEAEMDRKHKASVFSRISFPAEEQAAKKKKSSSSEVAQPHKSNGYHDDYKAASTVKRVAMEVDGESSDDEEDRHFKRRPARYEPSPAPPEDREDRRHSRGRERERSGRDERERKHK